MVVNNETGSLLPVHEIGTLCRDRRVPLLLDACQAVGKIPLDLKALRPDYLALSAHKLGGPQGVGALVVRDGIVLAPLIPGGAQERRRRAGTPSVAAIAGFGAAAQAAHERVKQILAEHTVEPLDSGVEAELERIVRRVEEREARKG